MYRTLDRAVLRDIALVCLADTLVGLSYGAIAVGSGLAPWVPIAMSLVVLAGASQFLFVGMVAAGASPLAAAAAGLLVNARHLPFGLAVGEAVGPGWRRVVGSHLMNDETVAFALGQREREAQRAAYWVCGVAILVAWNAGVLVGALAGTAIGDTDALADHVFVTFEGAFLLFVHGATLLAALILLVYGWEFARFGALQYSEIAGLPMVTIYIAWPLSGLTWLAFLGEKFWEDLRILRGEVNLDSRQGVAGVNTALRLNPYGMRTGWTIGGATAIP